MTPLFFSIIIPTYNRTILIKEAINGIVNQSFKDFELIIVDDGSTDDSELSPYLYPFPNYPQFFRIRKSKIGSSSVFFICKQK
jgi:glycosyltransferase involved in cell wall biosynthesis